MDREKAVALITSYELGSLSAAAEKLNYTPSGLSKMLNSVENEIGFKLFVRGKNGVKATKNFEVILPILQELVYWGDMFNEVSSQIRGLDIGDISVGSAYTIYYKWLSNVIFEFSKKYPQINIRIIEGTSSKLSEKVEERLVDFCIISKRDGEYDWIELFEDELLVMLPKNHPFAKLEFVPLEKIESESFIEIYPGLETDNSRVFKNNGIKPNIKFSALDSFAASHLVESNLGISLVNNLVAKNISADVEFRKIFPPQVIEIGIAIPKGEIMSPSAKKFLEFSMKYLDKLKI